MSALIKIDAGKMAGIDIENSMKDMATLSNDRAGLKRSKHSTTIYFPVHTLSDNRFGLEKRAVSRFIYGPINTELYTPQLIYELENEKYICPVDEGNDFIIIPKNYEQLTFFPDDATPASMQQTHLDEEKSLVTYESRNSCNTNICVAAVKNKFATVKTRENFSSSYGIQVHLLIDGKFGLQKWTVYNLLHGPKCKCLSPLLYYRPEEANSTHKVGCDEYILLPEEYEKFTFFAEEEKIEQDLLNPESSSNQCCRTARAQEASGRINKTACNKTGKGAAMCLGICLLFIVVIVLYIVVFIMIHNKIKMYEEYTDSLVARLKNATELVAQLKNSTKLNPCH